LKYGIVTAETQELQRNLRAIKFGLNTNNEASNNGGNRKVTSKHEEKLAMRAVKFGLTTAVSGEQEAKLKARAERFAMEKNSNLDDEDEKRRKRAERFVINADASGDTGRVITNSLANKRFKDS
jgi:hypothetical protein